MYIYMGEKKKHQKINKFIKKIMIEETISMIYLLIIRKKVWNFRLKIDVYGHGARQEYINKGGAKFSDDEDKPEKNVKPKKVIKKVDGIINDDFMIKSNKPKPQPIEEKKYTSFKGKTNAKTYGLTLNKKKVIKKENVEKTKTFSIQKQNKFQYDDDLGEVTEKINYFVRKLGRRVDR